MADAQAKINNAGRRFSINPWRPASPLVFVLWGALIAAIGLAWLVL
jgi:hypothetical protein